MRIPQATYRIQFTPSFGFREGAEIVPYLAALGISDLYASPIFRARTGSSHGYDIVDFGELNPELGGGESFAVLNAAASKRGLGWLQDIVPNHMAFDGQNPYLGDLLENGPGSAYFHYFDIDWEHYNEGIRGKVLAPFLGRFFGQALEAGEIRLGYAEQGFSISYFELRFPLRIESYLNILTASGEVVHRELGKDHPDYIQLLGVLYVLKTLRSEAGNGERLDQGRFIKQTLWALYRNNRSIRRAIDAAVRSFNGRQGEPESFNQLEGLLAEQWFRLAFWKVATEEVNYRRFFSINHLISLKVEDEAVFVRTHALPLRLLNEGTITGLRIDHIDGLYDPTTYLTRLRAVAPETYLVAEKILDREEPLPNWPIQGTTGYDFLNQLNGIFCQPGAAPAFSRLYRGFTGLRQPYAELVYENKKLIIEKHLFGDVNNLAHLLKNIAAHHRHGSDITMDSLKRALIEILALFPVYRSYLGGEDVRDFDRRSITATVTQAGERNPGLLIELNFIGRALLLELEEFFPREERTRWLHFVMRFQQLSGPLMAKGFEDTLFYVYNRLLSLNEVGGSPDRFGLVLEDFHLFCRRRREEWPHALNATATHDSKRGEDVRARLNVLSELPQEWGRQIRSWSRINRGKKQTVRRRKVPDKNDEYFLYQTLVGAWPFAEEDDPEFLSRFRGYLVKAVREAKVHTAWLKPDSAYEEAFLQFVDKVLSPRRGNAFLREFIPFQRRVAHFGILNSLSQTLIKIIAPGVPDFYQGTEFWDLSLVDPDNRRPVDFQKRETALRELQKRAEADLSGLLEELLATMADGRIKLFLIHRALGARRRDPRLFSEGEYLPLELSGSGKEHLIAFARRHEANLAVVLAPRFSAGWLDDGSLPLGREVWGKTILELPEGCHSKWQDAFTGTRFSGHIKQAEIGGILERFPVALLVSTDAKSS